MIACASAASGSTFTMRIGMVRFCHADDRLEIGDYPIVSGDRAEIDAHRFATQAVGPMSALRVVGCCRALKHILALRQRIVAVTRRHLQGANTR